MFGMLKNITKAAVGVVTAPVAVVADVVTLGGTLTDRDEPYTATQARKVVESVEKAVDPNED